MARGPLRAVERGLRTRSVRRAEGSLPAAPRSWSLGEINRL